jgi:hypothetical protein
MDDGIVRINELRLRVTGMSAEEGRVLGQEVADRVSEEMSCRTSPQQLGALNITVPVPAGTPRNNIAPLVAQAILRGLKWCSSK